MTGTTAAGAPKPARRWCVFGGKAERRVIPLNPRFDLWKHSPNGFEWGYSGSGPAQLALALLAHVLLGEGEAVVLHHAFKDEVVAELNHGGWIQQPAGSPTYLRSGS